MTEAEHSRHPARDHLHETANDEWAAEIDRWFRLDIVPSNAVMRAFVNRHESAVRAACADELRAHATVENQDWLIALANSWESTP